MQDFFSPSRQHAPILCWRWNDELREEVVLCQLDQIDAAGYGGIIIETTPEATPPLFNDDWFSILEQCLAQARDAGLKVWIGSTLGVGPPASFARFQEENVLFRAPAPWQPPALNEADLLCALAAPLREETNQPDFARAVDLRSQFSDAASLLRGLRADAKIWLWTQQEYSQADSLHPQTAQSWIEQIGETMDARLREYSGTTFRGFYLPMPSLWPDEACPDGHCFPWSEVLPETFARLHSYELAPRLPSLIANTGEDAAKVRQDYWAAIANLQCEVWNALNKWAGTRNLEIFCKFPAANSLQEITQHNGKVAVLLSALTHVAVEVNDARFDLTARLAASQAALRGDLTVIAVHPSRSGATPASRLETLHHAMRYGLTRFVFPAEYSRMLNDTQSELQQPYFDRAELFTQYLAQCGAALSRGRHGARLGLLWPGRSAQAHYHPGGHRFARWAGEDLEYALELLDELRYDTILLPEEALCAASCEDGKLWCGEARLPIEMVIVAGATTLSRAAWEKIEEFTGCGGKVACLGLLPRWSEDGRDRDLEEHINKTTLTTIADSYETAEGTRVITESYPIFHELRSSGRLCCYQPRLNHDADDARRRVRQILRESLAPDVETQAASIRYARRVLDEGELFFVFNDNNLPQRVRLRLQTMTGQNTLSPRRADAWSGEFQPISVWMKIQSEEVSSVSGGLSLLLDFASHEAALVMLAPTPDQHTQNIERANFQVETSDASHIGGYATQSGVPAAAIRPGGKGRLRWHRGVPVQVPSPLLLSGDWQITLRSPNVWQSTHFRLTEHLPQLALALPRETASTPPLLNGQVMPILSSPYPDNSLWNDLQWRWFGLHAARVGINEIGGLTPGTSSFIVGEFEIDDEFGLAEIEALLPAQPLSFGEGSWHEQGLPYYVGTAEYFRRVQVPDDWLNCRIFLELSRARDVVELKINETSCGIRLAAPYRWDVTSHITPGAELNLQLSFSNTTSALEMDEPVPSGLLGPARLVAYPTVVIALQDETQNQVA